MDGRRGADPDLLEGLPNEVIRGSFMPQSLLHHSNDMLQVKMELICKAVSEATRDTPAVQLRSMTAASLGELIEGLPYSMKRFVRATVTHHCI
jgi:hypothetical protein